MWRLLDHTADVCLEIEAASWPGLLEEAARACGAWARGTREAGGIAKEGCENRAVELRGADAVETWVRYWRALHRLWAVGGSLPVDAAVEEGASPTHVRAAIACLPVGALEPGSLADVKAVTWHGAAVEERGDGRWIGRIVLDL
jgi:SHS2 domain-containing protein